MKTIKLTQEHKDKLLEIAKAIFPKYEFSWEYEMNGRALKQYFDGVLAIFGDDLSFGKNIHWFEFCCNSELIEKLLNKGNLSDHLHDNVVRYFEQCIIFKNEHPIDHLYEHFKKTT